MPASKPPTPGSPQWRLDALRFSLQYLMVALHSEKFPHAQTAARYLQERGIDSWDETVDALKKTVEKNLPERPSDDS